MEHAHLYCIKVDEKWGFINDQGHMVVDPEYDRVGEYGDVIGISQTFATGQQLMNAATGAYNGMSGLTTLSANNQTISYNQTMNQRQNRGQASSVGDLSPLGTALANLKVR